MAGGTPDLIFLHHKKTGGTTLRFMFKDRYPTAYYTPESKGSLQRYINESADTFDLRVPSNDSQLDRFRMSSPSEQARFRVLVGHFWFGVDEAIGRPADYVTVLRDPVDRVLSLYADYTQDKGMTVPLDRYIRAERDYEISNCQTRRLATSSLADHVGDVTQTMFDVAAERLTERFLVVGTTERFDESVVAIGHALRWRSLGYAMRNASARRLTKSQLPRPLLERLTERNQFDAQLHQVASDMLDKALVGIDVPAALQRLKRQNVVKHYRDAAKGLGSKAKQAAQQRLAR